MPKTRLKRPEGLKKSSWLKEPHKEAISFARSLPLAFTLPAFVTPAATNNALMAPPDVPTTRSISTGCLP